MCDTFYGTGEISQSKSLQEVAEKAKLYKPKPRWQQPHTWELVVSGENSTSAAVGSIFWEVIQANLLLETESLATASLVLGLELFKVWGADSKTSIYPLILSPVLKDFSVLMIMDLKAIKLFNLLSHGLHSRCGKDSMCNTGFMWIFSAAASSAQFPLPNKFFQWETLSNDLHNLQQFKRFEPTDFFAVFSVDGHLTFHCDPHESGRSNTWVYFLPTLPLHPWADTQRPKADMEFCYAQFMLNGNWISLWINPRV